MTTTATARPGRIILRAARIFDGSRRVPDADGVLVDGATIVAVGPSATLPDDATLVDLPRATLLPGLVDTHVHLVLDASTDPVGTLLGQDDTAALAAMTAAGRTAVQAGVTTVRDLGDRRYLGLVLRETARTDPTLPTVVASGPPITTPGGHCHFLGSEADGVDGVRAAVRAHAGRGVDVIKIMASGGNLTSGSRPELPQFGTGELRAAVAEAHRLGLPITAHVHSTEAVLSAVAAGVDGLEHVTFMTADGVDPVPEGLLADIVDRRIVLGLTLGVVPGRGVLGPILARMPALMANARVICGSGARIVTGTDGGVSPGKPHDVLPWSVEALTRVGMHPVDALRAATSEAAAACGLGHRKGRLAPGYDADVLAVDGDPLADPPALRAVRAVVVRGARVR